MRLASWNVNGIRSAARGGFREWLAESDPDIVCLQETRAEAGQLAEDLRSPAGYHAFWHSAGQPGYSGVATFCREPPLAVQYGFGVPHFDAEGRVLISDHPTFALVNAYFPSGRRGQERVAFKLEFYDALLGACIALRSQGRVLIICGDLNTAHQPIDLARPSQNRRLSGFLPEEREALGRWLENGFVDIYRRLCPDAVAYTWWSNLFDARSRNVGWRIDYFLVDEELLPRIREARILPEVRGSDHCPILLEID